MPVRIPRNASTKEESESKTTTTTLIIIIKITNKIQKNAVILIK